MSNTNESDTQNRDLDECWELFWLAFDRIAEQNQEIIDLLDEKAMWIRKTRYWEYQFRELMTLWNAKPTKDMFDHYDEMMATQSNRR